MLNEIRKTLPLPLLGKACTGAAAESEIEVTLKLAKPFATPGSWSCDIGEALGKVLTWARRCEAAETPCVDAEGDGALLPERIEQEPILPAIDAKQWSARRRVPIP